VVNYDPVIKLIHIYIYIYNYVNAFFCINKVKIEKDGKVVDPFITLRMPT
jgi:hypothetical protein